MDILGMLGTLCALAVLLTLASRLCALSLFVLFSSLLGCYLCFLECTIDTASYQDGDEHEYKEYEEQKAEDSF